MGIMMKEVDELSDMGRNVIVTSHYEVIEHENGINIIKPKTAGKAVDNYLSLEGRFDIIIYAMLDVDSEGNIEYKFLTQPKGQYHNLRSPFGMFDKAEIPNDMGIILDYVNKYQEEAL